MSETETAKYSVFWDDGWQPNNGSFAGLSLNEFIARCAEEFGPPVAWAAEWTFVYEGHKTHKQLHAESIAAGRLIDCIDGKYVARGIEDPELVALQTRPQHVEASCEGEGLGISRGGNLMDRNTVETFRAPLPYFTEAKRFDPFSDFIVHHREEVSVNAKPFANLSLDGCEQFRAPRSI